MKRTIFILLAISFQTGLFAQQYFPEGTRWTEIRLDTQKYDTWYTKVGEDWVPNFETVEYQVEGTYTEDFWEDGDFKTFKCVHTSSAENADSLFLLLYEDGHGWNDDKWIEVTPYAFYEGHIGLWPARAYTFKWEIGTKLHSITINGANCTCLNPESYEFGTIEEIKEGNFGGATSLKYVDLDGVRIIQGIGVTEWNGGECLFGPVKPYEAYIEWSNGYADIPNYRSRLVHFERSGEVLYDIWPEKGTDAIGQVYDCKAAARGAVHDLSGRPVTGKSASGIYIKNGKKVLLSK